MKKIIILVFTLAMANGVFAALFNIRNEVFSGSASLTDSNGNEKTGAALDYANRLQEGINNQLLDIESQVNGKIPDTSSLSSGLVNSTAFAGKGIGVDYASDIKLFSIGVLGSTGISTGNNSIKDVYDSIRSSIKNGGIPKGGFAVMGSVYVGVNSSKFLEKKIGPIDPKRLNLYVNFMVFKLPASVGDKVNTNSTTVGAHAQYKLVPSKDFVPIKYFPGLAKWTGVDIISGLEYSHFSLTIPQALSQTTTSQVANPITNGNDDIESSWNVTSALSVSASTISVPFEITTGFQMLHILTLYTGVGFDFTVGSGGSITTVDGPITGINKTQSNETIFSADANADLGDSQAPTFATIRSMFGLQVNISAFKVFAQANIGAGNLYAVNAGIKAAW